MRSFLSTAAAAAVMAFGSVTHASLILHWDLDGSGTKELVSGNTTNTQIVGPVQTGQAPIAPTGTGSIWLPNTEYNNGSAYLEAGTYQANGQYVAGAGDGSPKLLNGAFTISAWIDLPDQNFTNQPRAIINSSRWSAVTGWGLQVRNHEVVFDFGSDGFGSGINIPQGGSALVVVQREVNGISDGQGGTFHNRIGVFDGTTWTWAYGNQGEAHHTPHLDALRIGLFGNDRYWVGGIDDIRIYDHLLTDEELATLAGVVPEPASLALIGLGGMLVLRRTRRA